MQYLTIKEKVETQIIRKKSKFIANLIPVEDRKNLEEKLQKIKHIYHDARHNCFAYRILEDEKIVERASDDGEPSGTAGAPILEILRGNNLVNIIVVVTRYFGGILLGTGGLVKAYSDVAVDAIKIAKKVNLEKVAEFEIEIEYSQIEKLKYYLNKIGGIIREIKYSENIKLNIYVPSDLMDFFTKKYSNTTFKMIKCTFIKVKFVDISANITQT